MADDAQYLSTPENYATPQQLASARAYAQALLGVGKNDMNQPINHWTQGMANVVKALVGGNELHQQAELERNAHNTDAASLPRRTDDVPQQMPTGFASPADAAPMPARNYADTDSSPLPVKAVPTSTIPAKALDATGGPDTFNERWPGPDQQMDQYNATPGSFGLPAAHPQDPQAMSFDGTPQNVPASGPDAIAQALALGKGGATGNAPFGGRPMGVPSGSDSSSTTIDPRTIPQLPQISRAQFERIMSSPLASEAMKATAAEAYFKQNQPMTVPTAGGNVVVDPRSGAQRFVPDIKWNTVKGGEGTEAAVPNYITPNGKGGFINNEIKEAPSGAAAAPPVQSAVGGPSVPTLKRPSPAPVAPTSATPLNFAADGIDKAGLPPEITGGASIPGMLGMAPPTIGGDIPTPPAGQNEQVAEIPSKLRELRDFSNQTKLDYEHRKELNDVDTKAMGKTYDALAAAGQVASQTKPQLELAKNIIEDPDFYSGIGGRAIALPIAQLQSTFGKNPEKASRMEVFDKIISGQIVQDLKTQLQGLGQVRVAEIDLLSKAAANLDRTKPANRAVLDLMIRTHDQIDNLSKVANDYRQGYRFDKDGNAVMTNEIPTKAGLDASLKKYVEANPVLTPEERKNYEFLFKKYDKNRYESTKKTLEDAQYGRSQESSSDGAQQPPPGGTMRAPGGAPSVR